MDRFDFPHDLNNLTSEQLLNLLLGKLEVQTEAERDFTVEQVLCIALLLMLTPIERLN